MDSGVCGTRFACSTFSGLKKEGVAVGDIIYVEAATGQVRRVGRSEEYAGQFDLEADKFVPVPKGDVHKKKEVIQVSTSTSFRGAVESLRVERDVHFSVLHVMHACP